MMICAFLLGFLGAVAIYLTHPQQRLLGRPLTATARLAGMALIVASVWSWCAAGGVAAGVSGALTSLMLAWVALPYAAWWRNKQLATLRKGSP
ncbi:hypothetical protein [Dyella acidiphila]|uniref:DUF3325 domain-containing protein n=1 Tax=Dyella acidiphila TaxID=2775866 RepID=A0ABR9GFL9_9GAMM|nr:hypothetical protein [Dyella acidiphila]MBE1162850.1 hypothetical protein [Dyella acidiphila]